MSACQVCGAAWVTVMGFTVYKESTGKIIYDKILCKKCYHKELENLEEWDNDQR